MRQETSGGRLLAALRLAFHPAFASAKAKRFEALTLEAENARHAGDLAKAERLYSMGAKEAQASADSSYLWNVRQGLARVYQEERRYREAERIYQELLEVALASAEPNTLIHAGHMSLALLYQDEGRFVEAERHFRSALAKTENPELFPGRGFWCSTSMWLARFYVAQQRCSEAEVLFQKALEIHEKDPSPTSYLPQHLREFAQFYEVQGKNDAAETLYQRALEASQLRHGASNLSTVRALHDLADFYRARKRYAEAEELCRRSLAIVEKDAQVRARRSTRGWRPWRNRKELQADIDRIHMPISTALDRLAAVYEDQGKYAEEEPLRRRSLEIKEQVWSESHPALLGDSLAAHAHVLHKLGREQEAADLDKRVLTLRSRYPKGMQCSVRAIVKQAKRTLPRRLAIFVTALLPPRPAQTGNRPKG